MKEFPPFRLDTVNQCLWRCGEAEDERVSLTPKAFAVLRYLVEHAGRLVTQDELLEALWPNTFVQPEVLKYQIADIRSALGDRAKNPLFIETLPRRGYQFIAALREGEPSEATGSGLARLVGRDRELAALRACFQKALKGQRQIVFITGEPGIGKTALVDEFQRQAAAEEPSLRIARGQCVEGYGGAEAYYPMLEALGELCHGSEGKRVVEILAAQAPTWLVQFPSLLKQEQRQMLQQEILGATRERMLREIREALDALTSQAPLLLVFEDLQWVDPSTIGLISALARGRTTAKIMVIITKRPLDAVVPDHPLKRLREDLLVHHLCHEIALAPLSVAHIAEYLRTRSLGTLPEGFAELIHRHSEGNPLFMVVLLGHMIDRDLISRENEKWQLRVPLEEIDLSVPETLRHMIEAQIDHLTTEEQRALEVASVAGALFSANVVARAMKVDTELLEELFERLSRRSHIVRVVRVADSQQLADGQYFEFVHAMYREVLYLRQTPMRRASLHVNIGQSLEDLFSQRLPEVAVELAGHFELGGDWQRAIKYCQRAADLATRRLEPRQAAEILERALELAKRVPDADRADHEIAILEKLAPIYVASFDSRACETCEALVSKAAQHGRTDVEVRALVNWAFIVLNNSDRGFVLLERALQLAATLDPAKYLPTYATCLFWSFWASGRDPQHVEEYRKAIREIRELENPQIVGTHLLNYSCIQWCSSEYRESHQSSIDGFKKLSEADGADAFLSISRTLGEAILPCNLIFLGEWGDAFREIDRAITMANRNGDYFIQARVLQLCRAWLHLHACDFAGVLRMCDSAVPLVWDPAPRFAPDVPSHNPFYLQLSLILRGSAEAALGGYDRAREYLFAARDDMDRRELISDWYWRMPLEWGLTELWLAERNLTQAGPQAERFLSVTLTTSERTWQALAWEANARVAIAEGDLDRAQECIAKALSTMEGFEVPLAAWRVHAAAFELYQNSGDRDFAESHLVLSRKTIMKLANSLPAEEPLRQTFLSAPMVHKILSGGGTLRPHAKGA